MYHFFTLCWSLLSCGRILIFRALSCQQVSYFRLTSAHRYKKLLSSVDLTKDFFYSYTYPIMRSLQKNVQAVGGESVPYENIFVWNTFLTRAIRSRCINPHWTIALVHGHFKQVFAITNFWLGYLLSYFLYAHDESDTSVVQCMVVIALYYFLTTFKKKRQANSRSCIVKNPTRHTVPVLLNLSA